MNLEEMIHQRWAASGPLASLLPVERVKTGRSFADGAPYATIARRANRTAFRTNAGDALDEVLVEIHVWHNAYDDGRAILEQLKVAFDRADFDLADGNRVVQMRRADDRAIQHDDGTWQFTIEFLAQIHLPSGA